VSRIRLELNAEKAHLRIPPSAPATATARFKRSSERWQIVPDPPLLGPGSSQRPSVRRVQTAVERPGVTARQKTGEAPSVHWYRSPYTMLAVMGLCLFTATASQVQLRTVVEGADSPILERLEIVVRSQQEWQALWSRLSPGRELPTVDFLSDMLVGIVAPGSSTELRLEVLSISHEDGALVVRYRVGRRPNAGQLDGAHTHPYQVVAIPKTRRRVRFLEVLDAPTGRKP
jgi:hypothetical protein